MQIPAQPMRPRSENVIALINVVFLLLMFFLMTSTITPPLGIVVDPAQTSGRTQPEAFTGMLAVDKGGALAFEGKLVARARLAQTLAAYARTSPGKPLRVMADRALKASALLVILDDAKKAGIKAIVLITRRGERT